MQEEKKIEKELIENTLKLLEGFPSDKKLFYNTGVLMVEVSKEEAVKLLKEKLKELEGKA